MILLERGNQAKDTSKMKYDGRNSTVFGFDLREDGEGMPLPARKNLRENQLMGMGRSKRGFRYQQGWSPKWGKSEWTQVKVSVGLTWSSSYWYVPFFTFMARSRLRVRRSKGAVTV